MTQALKKTLSIPHLSQVHYHSPMDEVIRVLASCPPLTLQEAPWPAYPYKPAVGVRIGHTRDSLVLQFSVEEKSVKAEYRNTNDPVYRDSCVEFFISFDGINYYNLEFNCIGTGFIGYGNADKTKRRPLAKAIVEQVKTHAVINTERRAEINWELVLNVPFTVFGSDTIGLSSGSSCTGNFHKCGDELPEPHFIAWNPIDYPTPNFHLPQFFGKLFFL